MALVRNRIRKVLSDAIIPLQQTMKPDEAANLSVELEIPKASQHGDYASNIAMTLTRYLRRKPREIAVEIVENLRSSEDLFEKVEIAGPGFLNFFVRPSAWQQMLKEVHAQAENYGRQDFGRGKRVQVEFVSANPTGPLHIGHGRGAATGDVLASVLATCGYEVEREYYINDAGNQMDTLGRSLYYRYQQELGESIEFPENHYQGEYMRDLARDLTALVQDRYRQADLEKALPEFARFAGDHILAGIKNDLNQFGVSFDEWFRSFLIPARI